MSEISDIFCPGRREISAVMNILTENMLGLETRSRENQNNNGEEDATNNEMLQMHLALTRQLYKNKNENHKRNSLASVFTLTIV